MLELDCPFFKLRLKWAPFYVAAGTVPLVVGIILLVSNILLFVGAHKRQRVFFFPWLIVIMIGIVLASIAAIFLLVYGNHLKFSSLRKQEQFFFSQLIPKQCSYFCNP